MCNVKDIPARDGISANPAKPICGVPPDIQ